MTALRDIVGRAESEVEAQLAKSNGEPSFASLIRSAGKSKSGKFGGTVGMSTELKRILALPRRQLDLTIDCNAVLRRPGGTMSLWPVQSVSLVEAAIMNGLFAPIAAGEGKELICLLLPEALDSKRAVIMLPAAIKRQTEKEARTIYAKHFYVPLDVITFVSYEELSDARTADVLERVQPDLIVLNECHKIQGLGGVTGRRSSRGTRFNDYTGNHPECRTCALSGTVTRKSIKQIAPLSELCLRDKSPLPRGYREVSDWAGALDVKPDYVMAPGALRKFCGPEAGGPEGETVRAGFRRRLVESQGVVASAENQLGISLIVERIADLPVPAVVKAALDEVQKHWSIGGEKFAEITTKVSKLRQVAQGFYYRYVWPDGVPDYDWLEARAAWASAVNEKLARPQRGMDSPMLLAQAAERAFLGKPNGWPCEAWSSWREQKHKQEPPKEAIWIDEYLCHDALRRAELLTKQAPCVVWVEYQAVGEKLAELSGLPYFGQGTNAMDAVEAKADICIASRRVQGTGLNLQRHFGTNLLTCLPYGAVEIEQQLARTHRNGQERDEVLAHWYGHVPELSDLMAKILEEAKFEEEAIGVRQRILYSTRIG